MYKNSHREEQKKSTDEENADERVISKHEEQDRSAEQGRVEEHYLVAMVDRNVLLFGITL